MFVQLLGLVPKKGVIVMTLSRGVTEGNLRLTLHPRIPDEDVAYEPGISRLKPIVFDDVKPEELDDPAISFEPVVVAKLSVEASIKAAADASVKAAAEETAKEKAKKDAYVAPAKAKAKKPAETPAPEPTAQPELCVPASPLPDRSSVLPEVKPDEHEIAKEKARKDSEAAAAKAKADAEKKAKADDAKAKQAELAAQVQKAEELGFKW